MFRPAVHVPQDEIACEALQAASEGEVSTASRPKAPGPRCPHVGGEPFDPLGPEGTANPWPWYETARREAPVFYLAEHDVWCVTRYEDVLEVLRDTQTFSSANAFKWRPLPACLEDVYPDGHPGQRSMIMKDPPEHTRIRRPANKALTPKAVRELEPKVARRCHVLIDSFVDDGRCELISQFSSLLPVQVITDIVEAPLDADVAFLHWARDQFWLVEGAPPLNDEQAAQMAERDGPFMEWLIAFVDERRRNPGEDFVSELLYAESADGEPVLTTEEVIGIINSLLVAGTETTAISIPLILRELLRRPEQWAEVRADPSLIPSAVEEGLRYCSPARGTRRLVTRDTTLGGVEIPAGAEVHIMLASTQRDEAIFEEPDTFDIHRTDVSKHLAFGRGTHMCLGAPLARLELCAGLQALIERIPGIRLVEDQPDQWIPHMSLPRLMELHLEWN
jgi:cytochrome P450